MISHDAAAYLFETGHAWHRKRKKDLRLIQKMFVLLSGRVLKAICDGETIIAIL
jgi:hypothetical protein